MTSQQIDQIAAQFLDQSLPAQAWTHEAHLAVGCWHLREYDFYDALCRMKAGIILLNHAHGTPNNQNRGYHETLTWLWLTVLKLWLENGPGNSLEEKFNALINSPVASKTLPFYFYSESEIKDPTSRALLEKPKSKPLSWETLQSLT